MFNLAEYRTKSDRLIDLLPWAALIAKGVVLNKDGSFQRTMQYRGPDLESSTKSQLVAATARLNNILKRLGSGWVIYIEALRHHSVGYSYISHFPDPVSWLVDAERRESFEKEGENFESEYFITFQFLPPKDTSTKISGTLVKENVALKEDYQKSLDFFIATTDRSRDIFKDIMFEAFFLDDSETLTYLHSTISSKKHWIRAPSTPMYLDALLADMPLVGGLSPKLGDHHLKTITVLGFPASTMPALLDQLNQLPICYRWVTRFISLDKGDAERELKGFKRRWFSKRKGLLHLLQEIFTRSESQLIDTAAMDKAQDADQALKELSEDYVAYGYYTATITVMDRDFQQLTSKEREVERVINGLGFATIAESFNAVEAWLSSLPGQAYANVRRPMMHTLNLSHIMPFSAIWSGPVRDNHLKAPPLMYVSTQGNTPFRLVNHIGDVGHQMIIGPTGAGKSVLLNMMALQFRRYKQAQVFIFDKGGSFLASTEGVNGGYYELGHEEKGLVFQPLSQIDGEVERIWASDWIQGLLINEHVEISPAVKQAVWAALTALSKVPIEQRTLTGFSAMIQDATLRAALSNYTLNGPFGHLLDADHEIECNQSWQCYELESLMGMPQVIAPVLSYLFHRLEKLFIGVPTMLILDEAWLFLDHPMFALKIRDWLKSLRKRNVSVIFATQSVEDALSASIAPALLENCPSRILLPNDRALETKIQTSYEMLGLNDRQLHILATATPKRQYYFQSRLGNRLFNLELGPIALAFCAMSRPEDRVLIKELIAQYGQEGFLKHYLKKMNLEWAWGVAQEANTFRDGGSKEG